MVYKLYSSRSCYVYEYDTLKEEYNDRCDNSFELFPYFDKNIVINVYKEIISNYSNGIRNKDISSLKENKIFKNYMVIMLEIIMVNGLNMIIKAITLNYGVLFKINIPVGVLLQKMFVKDK